MGEEGRKRKQGGVGIGRKQFGHGFRPVKGAEGPAAASNKPKLAQRHDTATWPSSCSSCHQQQERPNHTPPSSSGKTRQRTERLERTHPGEENAVWKPPHTNKNRTFPTPDSRPPTPHTHAHTPHTHTNQVLNHVLRHVASTVKRHTELRQGEIITASDGQQLATTPPEARHKQAGPKGEGVAGTWLPWEIGEGLETPRHARAHPRTPKHNWVNHTRTQPARQTWRRHRTRCQSQAQWTSRHAPR
jgi:hypothetical protein